MVIMTQILEHIRWLQQTRKTDQANHDRNIKGEVKLDLNTEKNGNMNKQTYKVANKVSNNKKL
jgi:hypothetical protein